MRKNCLKGTSLENLEENEMLFSEIRAMQKQEDLIYRCGDYLSKLNKITVPVISTENSKSCCVSSMLPIDEECRSKMSFWSFQVAEYCGYQRDTVSVAMSIFDRFLHHKTLQTQKSPSTSVLYNRHIFQLASVTSFYIAVKLYEHEVMDPKFVTALSRGNCSEQEVATMELQILNTIQWHVHPPTPISFVHLFLSLIDHQEISPLENKIIMEHSQFQTELSVNDYHFVDKKPSVIAIASMMNAIDMMVDQNISSFDTRLLFLERVRKISSIQWFHDNEEEMFDTRERLLHLYSVRCDESSDQPFSLCRSRSPTSLLDQRKDNEFVGTVGRTELNGEQESFSSISKDSYSPRCTIVQGSKSSLGTWRTTASKRKRCDTVCDVLKT